jgi:Zn ribbon nucleic-acid-binding protein
MTLAHVLDGLRCAACHTLNVLWLDPVRALVECRECGQTAIIVHDINEGRFL